MAARVLTDTQVLQQVVEQVVDVPVPQIVEERVAVPKVLHGMLQGPHASNS